AGIACELFRVGGATSGTFVASGSFPRWAFHAQRAEYTSVSMLHPCKAAAGPRLVNWDSLFSGAARPLGAPLGVCLALVVSIALAGCRPQASAVTIEQAPAKDPNVVRVTDDQLHQLNVAKVEGHQFRIFKQAVGQIAFNEDASTVVLTPFSGRV